MKLPSNYAAERALLGICSMRPIHAGEIQEDRFHDPTYREIFHSIKSLAQEKKPTDLLAIQAHLESRGKLDGIGGVLELTSIITEGMALFGNFTYYYELLEEAAAYRRFVLAAQKAIKSAEKMSDPLTDLLSTINKDSQTQQVADLPDISKQITKLMDDLEEKVPKERFSTGLEPLDDYLYGGVERKEFIVFAAKTSKGKSIALGQLALEALHKEKKTAVFSLEMPDTSLLQRYLSNICDFQVRPLMEKKLNAHECSKLMRAAQELAEKKFFLFDGETSLDRILATAARIKQKEGLDLLVIDYLQRLDETEDTREMSIARNARLIKSFALNNNCVVASASQINDDGHLFASRAIGHEADILIFADDDCMKIVKNRRGAANVKIDTIRRGEVSKFVPKPPDVVKVSKHR